MLKDYHQSLTPVMRHKRWIARHKPSIGWEAIISVVGLVIFWIAILWAIGISRPADAQEAQINMDKIMMIESSGNPLAWNKKDDSRGLFQIREIAFKDYLQFHQNSKLNFNNMWDPNHNKTVAEWMIAKRIPAMLRHYGIPETTLTIIATYNWGIGNVVKWQKIGGNFNDLPKITQRYYEKYNRN